MKSDAERDIQVHPINLVHQFLLFGKLQTQYWNFTLSRNVRMLQEMDHLDIFRSLLRLKYSGTKIILTGEMW